MKNSSILASLTILLLLACGGGGGSNDNNQPGGQNPPPLATVPPYQLENTDSLIAALDTRLNGLNIDDFFEESYGVLVERIPEAIIGDGALGFYPNLSLDLDNISDDYYFQTIALKQRILDNLLDFNRANMTQAQQLSYDIYQSYLEFEIEGANFKAFEFPASYGFFGWPGTTEQFFTQVMQVTNKADADNYLILLNQVERRFNQIEILLDNRQADGVIEPSPTLNFSKGAVDAIANASATNTSYYKAFSSMLSSLSSISSDERIALLEVAQQTINERVLPAYRSLSTKMASLLNNAPSQIGFGQYTGGDEFYNYQLRYFTSSDKTADEIHQLGLDELEKIHSQMRALGKQLGYPEGLSIPQLYSRIDSAAGRTPANQALDVYTDLVNEAYTKLPQAFEQLPQQAVVVLGDPNGGGYYISGSDDGVRPGAFYANTGGPTPYTTMPTLTYHEAVPGHHLQIALAQELDLPLFRRKINFTNFVEGWGLYAERLASDLGWYENDIYGDLGRLQFEAMRAARLVIDTGIHSKGWSFAQADAFAIANNGYAGSTARYSVWPGQATAYSTGMLKLLELRERAQTQLGDAYDIKEFHSEVVGRGSMPMNILESVIDDYIADKLIQP